MLRHLTAYLALGAALLCLAVSISKGLAKATRALANVQAVRP